MSDPTLSDIDSKLKWLGYELPLKLFRLSYLPDFYIVLIYFYDSCNLRSEIGGVVVHRCFTGNDN